MTEYILCATWKHLFWEMWRSILYIIPFKGRGLYLTHWGIVTHICVSKRTIIGSDNGLSPSRHQAIIWTIAGILLIGPLGTNFSEIFIEENAFENVVCEMAFICLGLNVLRSYLFQYTRLVKPAKQVGMSKSIIWFVFKNVYLRWRDKTVSMNKITTNFLSLNVPVL